jgi:NhaA family Na+:H+ antiporter
MVLPILGYLVVTWGTPFERGFGVPVATDIAFGLALLMILGDRVPTALKAFLLAFAAADDVGGVLVIALFYGHGISLVWLAAAVAVAGLTSVIVRLKPQVTWTYAALGSALWATTALSGVHVTIAGVVFGLMIPIRRLYHPSEVAERVHSLTDQLLEAEPREHERLLGRLQEVTDRSESPAERFARILRPTVSYLILPIFGLGMAGTSLNADAWSGLVTQPAALGILTGLLVGKPLGVLGFSWLAVRSGVAALPPTLRWHHVAGAAMLSGIGFTVSLFIAGLAFEPSTLQIAKLAVLVSSVLAGAAGLVTLVAKR